MKNEIRTFELNLTYLENEESLASFSNTVPGKKVTYGTCSNTLGK
jgi:hypothetical protein